MGSKEKGEGRYDGWGGRRKEKGGMTGGEEGGSKKGRRIESG